MTNLKWVKLPSTSLLVRTGRRQTYHADGGFRIHLRSIKSSRALSSAVLARVVRVWKADGMSSRGSAISCFMYRCVASLFMYVDASQRCWMRRQLDRLDPMETASLDGDVWKGALDGFPGSLNMINIQRQYLKFIDKRGI